MKAQHPPHVPSHRLPATERFQSPCFSGKAAGAATRRWWHPGGHQLHRPQACVPIYRQQKMQEKKLRIIWTNLEVGTWRGYLHRPDWRLKCRSHEKKRTIAEKVTGLQLSRQPEYSWWEYFSGQNTFIYALFNLTEVSPVALRGRHDYFTQWEEGKQPLSCVNLLQQRTSLIYAPKSEGLTFLIQKLDSYKERCSTLFPGSLSVD